MGENRLKVTISSVMVPSCPKTLSTTNQSNTGKAAIDRITDVYLDGGRVGRGKAAKPGSTKSKAGRGELPNVATVARFAIERERLAREMGVDELGGPATLGVVNVGAASAPHGKQQGHRSLNDKGGGRGSKRARNYEQGGGRGNTVDGSGGGGRRAGHNRENGAAVSAPEPEVVAERKSAGELLLEKLESVAEARSIESASGLRGHGDRTEGQQRVTHGKWHTEEEPSFFNEPAGEREGGAGGTGAGVAWGAPPVTGELSTTESAFLERSRRLNGLDGGRGGGDSLFGQHFEAGFRDERSVVDGDGSGGGGGAGGGSAAHVATIGALRDRLATLEGENAALRARARRAEEERAAEAARGDRASKKLAQVQEGVCARKVRLCVRLCVLLSEMHGVLRRHRVLFSVRRKLRSALCCSAPYTNA